MDIELHTAWDNYQEMSADEKLEEALCLHMHLISYLDGGHIKSPLASLTEDLHHCCLFLETCRHHGAR